MPEATPKLEPGAELPLLSVTPDKYVPHRYAGASGDFNPIHIDREFATAVGLPQNIGGATTSLKPAARAASTSKWTGFSIPSAVAYSLIFSRPTW